MDKVKTQLFSLYTTLKHLFFSYTIIICILSAYVVYLLFTGEIEEFPKLSFSDPTTFIIIPLLYLLVFSISYLFSLYIAAPSLIAGYFVAAILVKKKITNPLIWTLSSSITGLANGFIIGQTSLFLIPSFFMGIFMWRYSLKVAKENQDLSDNPSPT